MVTHLDRTNGILPPSHCAVVNTPLLPQLGLYGRLSSTVEAPERGLHCHLGAVALSGCDPSPARIPLECLGSSTKAPFTDGTEGGGRCEGEELEQDMDRGERVLLAAEEGGNHRALKVAY